MVLQNLLKPGREVAEDPGGEEVAAGDESEEDDGQVHGGIRWISL